MPNAIEKLRTLVEWCNERPEFLNQKATTIRELEREFDAALEASEFREGACPVCRAATAGVAADVIGSGIMSTRAGDKKGVMWPAIPCRGQHLLAELRTALGFNFRPNDPPDTFL